MDLGELGMIRNILVGQQMTEWDAKFEKLTNALQNHSELFEDQIGVLEKSSNKEFQNLEKQWDERFTKMEKLIEKRMANLEDKIIDSSSKDRQKIGKLLSDIGKKLMES